MFPCGKSRITFDKHGCHLLRCVVMTFNEAILREDRNLVDVRNLPAWECPTNASMVGPTAAWFDMIDSSRLIPQREIELIKHWKLSDSRYYAGKQTYLKL